MRVAVIGHRPKLDLSSMAPVSSKNIDQCVTGDRMVWCEGTKVSAKIYERLDLPVNAKVFGPAILEQPDTTIFIEPKMYGEVDKYGNLIIRWNKE
jgi:N-methylhydantoinase A